ncbi:MAG TPA: phosphoribosylamine--glycine ligase [Gammaproteobacteria bacterium]|nr:phosphoribosylamine--glycine ligase [Gammaproteobacteria bacterium]
MKVLVVGGGGREHALAWKIAQSPRAEHVFIAPGNAGTTTEPKCENVAIAADDIGGLISFVQERQIDLTIIGPEAPLVAGIADCFDAAGLACFGPSAAAAQLEGSKAFAKAFMERHGIPTAGHRTFTEVEPALTYVNELGAPVVVKADGLAAGKGVIVADTIEDAEAAVRDMLAGNAFGEAGHRVVVEEFLAGEEASFIVMTDGENVLPLATSQDHKRRDDGDRGPNTGGMGAYSPAPVITPAVEQRVLSEIVLPTVRGLAAEGICYRGFLYAGLMIAADGSPSVVEFNCRLGDPETQPILMRLKSDLLELCEAARATMLDTVQADWDPRPALGVVMAAGGYPGSYGKGCPISGLDSITDDAVKVFQAGTALRDNHVVTSGGRVLCVTALGDNIAAAQRRAYKAVDKISWRDSFYRRDIGHRAATGEDSGENE